MALREDIPKLIEAWRGHDSTLKHNEVLFSISEGELLPHVLADLKRQLSENSFERIKHRVPPINILIRIVDKLSKIYIRPPIRTIIGGKKRDQKALDELVKSLNYNVAMSEANVFFNTFKNTWVEPFLYKGKPSIRSIPSDRFFVYSNDKVDPTKPTHFVKIMGLDQEKKHTVFYGYTADEFLIFDSSGRVFDDLMLMNENPEGINYYGCLPGVYINRSRHWLTPKIDTDTLNMTKLIPVLLADCNFATMFQSFSIIYGIDVNDENLKMAPNAFWSFKSDPSRETQPQIGVLKPEVDTDKVLSLIKAELAMWLESKGIKPGTVGSMTVENAASGIAKMIDESDTTEDRKKQVSIFAPHDAECLELIINNMLPIWRNDPNFIADIPLFGLDYQVSTEFPEQKPIVDEGAATDTEIKKINAGLTTKKRAIKKLNPDMTDDEIESLMMEIESEKQPSPVTPDVTTISQDQNAQTPDQANQNPAQGVS